MTTPSVHYADLRGLPYQPDGRGPAAYDCYGLAVELFRRAGITLPDYTDPGNPAAQGALFTAGVNQLFTQVHHPRPLDLVLFRVARGLWHCGVVIDGYERFIHIMQRCNVAVEELHSPSWQHRLVGIYRWQGDQPC